MKNKLYILKSIQALNIILVVAVLGLLLEHASHKVAQAQTSKVNEVSR